MSTRVAIVDYEMGNLRSIANAMRAVGGDVQLVRDAAELDGVEHLVLPGVGAFGASMANLRERGLDVAIREHVAAGRPFLGICLGFQVLFARETEHGEHVGLGLLDGTVSRFETSLHVPHVGWNVLLPRQQHPVLAGLPEGAHMYFVHSFRPVGVDDDAVLAESEYDGRFVCAVARGSLVGTQFHPEKSGRDGLRLLQNFVTWRPR